MKLPKYVTVVPDGYVVDEQGNKWANWKVRVKWWGWPVVFFKFLKNLRWRK